MTTMTSTVIIWVLIFALLYVLYELIRAVLRQEEINQLTKEGFIELEENIGVLREKVIKLRDSQLEDAKDFSRLLRELISAYERENPWRKIGK